MSAAIASGFCTEVRSFGIFEWGSFVIRYATPIELNRNKLVGWQCRVHVDPCGIFCAYLLRFILLSGKYYGTKNCLISLLSGNSFIIERWAKRRWEYKGYLVMKKSNAMIKLLTNKVSVLGSVKRDKLIPVNPSYYLSSPLRKPIQTNESDCLDSE